MSEEAQTADVVIETPDLFQDGVVVDKPSDADEASKRLTAQLKAVEETAASERQGREAERAARIKAEDEAKSAKAAAQGHEITIVSNGIEAATRDREAANREWKRAMEAGEFDKAAQAQDDLSMASARLVQLESAKANMPSGGQVTEGRVEVKREAPPQRTGDPFEQYVSQLTPKSQAWVRQHPECVTSRSKNLRMMAAHSEATEDKKLQPETPEYFQFIEEQLGYRQPVRQQPVVDEPDEPALKVELAPATSHLQRPAMSAPVSRDPPNTVPRAPAPRSIKLSHEQQEAAKISGLTNEQYAANMIALQQEGKLGRVTH